MSFLEGSFTCQRYSIDLSNHDMHSLYWKLHDSKSYSTMPFDGNIGDTLYELEPRGLDKGIAINAIRDDYLLAEFVVTEVRPDAEYLRRQTLICLESSGKSAPYSKKDVSNAKKEVALTVRNEAKQSLRHVKYKSVPVVFDVRNKEAWFGSTSNAYVEPFVQVCKSAFGVEPVLRVPCDREGIPSLPATTPSWVPDSAYRNDIGNYFGLWLLNQFIENEGDLGHGVTLMPSDSLVLQCPTGVGGRDTFKHEVPTSLTEVSTALRRGYLPRSMGLRWVDGSDQYRCKLNLDTFSVTGGSVTTDDDDVERPLDRQELHQLGKVGLLLSSLELIYRRFLATWSYDASQAIE